MPRKSTVEELQSEEPPAGSLVRRSSRLVTGNGTPGATRSAQPTESNPPARATRGRRASAQDTEEEKVETKPAPRSRRSSILAEEEQTKETVTPIRRGRKPSVTKESDDQQETAKPVRSRRTSNSSVEDLSEKTQKIGAVRTRRGSASVEPEPVVAAKTPARRKSATSEIAAGEEVSTSAKRTTRARRNSDVDIIEDTKPAPRGRRKSITQDEPKVEEVKPIARRGRRVSTDSVASDTVPGTPTRRSTRRSSVTQEEEEAVEDNSAEISPVIREISVRITPFKKRRIIEQVEADLDLSIINESVGDDVNTSDVKSEQENKQVSPTGRKRLSPIDESQTPLRKSPRLSEKSSPKEGNTPTNTKPSNSLTSNQETHISTTCNDSFITQKSETKELNTSTESVGSNKENITTNEIKGKLVQQPIGLAARVSNVFKPNQKEYSFMEPMDVDQTINESVMEKSVVAFNVNSPKISADSTSNQTKKDDDYCHKAELNIESDADSTSNRHEETLEDILNDDTIIQQPKLSQEETKQDLNVTNEDKLKSSIESEVDNKMTADAINKQEIEDPCPIMARLEVIFSDDKIGNLEKSEIDLNAKSVDFNVVETELPIFDKAPADSLQESKISDTDASEVNFQDPKEESDFVAVSDTSFVKITHENVETNSVDASQAIEDSEISMLEVTEADSSKIISKVLKEVNESSLVMFEVTEEDKSITADSSKIFSEVPKGVKESSLVMLEVTQDDKSIIAESLFSEDAKGDSESSLVIDESVEKIQIGHSSSPLDSKRKSLRKSKSPQARRSLQNKYENDNKDVQIRQQSPQKSPKIVKDISTNKHIEADEEVSKAAVQDSIEDKDDENMDTEKFLMDEDVAGEIEQALETMEEIEKQEAEENGDQTSETEIQVAEEIKETEKDDDQASDSEIEIEDIILETSNKKATPPKERRCLDAFASSKLAEYLESKADYIENSSDEEESKDDEEKGEEESEVEYNSFIDGMAEEGEEETPSEDSNQIVDHGESIGSDSIDERSTNEDYEIDSFVCDEEHAELLLSDEEYDLGNEKKTKKKSRIMNNEQFGDEEIIKMPQKKVEPKKKLSRIIPASSSSEEEESSYIIKTDSLICKKGNLESSVISIQDSKDEENIRTNESVKASEIQNEENIQNNESEKVCEIQKSKSNENHISSPALKHEVIKDNKIPDDSSNTHEVSINEEARHSLNLLNQSRHRKSSLSIQENIFIDGVKDPRLSQRINSLVESFCSNVIKGEVSLNLSLEFEDAPINKEQEDIPVAGPSDKQHEDSPDQVELEVFNEEMWENVEKSIPPDVSQSELEQVDHEDILKQPETTEEEIIAIDDSESEELNKSAEQVDLREVLNKKLKRRLSKSLSEVYEETKKTKKRKKNNGKAKSRLDMTEYLGASSFGLVTQLITDVKNRPRRKVNPSSTAVADDSWTSSVVSNMKPSTSVMKEEKKPVASKPKLHPKDFKNQMLTDPSRVRRVETKSLLKKKGAFF